MAAMAGLLNHARTASQALAGQGPLGSASNPMAAAQANATSSTNSSSGNSATISSNDFLTLLVTEMQNQDPTADTDPNEYINQLVQVNSLEQLISINQNLTTALGLPGGSSGSGSSSVPAVPGAAAGPPANPAANATAGVSAVPQAAGSAAAKHAGGANLPAAINKFVQTQSPPAPSRKTGSASRSPGNLSVPAVRPAAHRVAHALDGQTPPARTAGKRSPGQ
jgi:flagellar basal-body rod modification protein FlgD